MVFPADHLRAAIGAQLTQGASHDGGSLRRLMAGLAVIAGLAAFTPTAHAARFEPQPPGAEADHAVAQVRTPLLHRGLDQPETGALRLRLAALRTGVAAVPAAVPVSGLLCRSACTASQRLPQSCTPTALQVDLYRPPQTRPEQRPSPIAALSGKDQSRQLRTPSR